MSVGGDPFRLKPPLSAGPSVPRVASAVTSNLAGRAPPQEGLGLTSPESALARHDLLGRYQVCFLDTRACAGLSWQRAAVRSNSRRCEAARQLPADTDLAPCAFEFHSPPNGGDPRRAK